MKQRKKINMLTGILSGIIALILIVFIIGCLLPAERVITLQSTFDTSPETLYSIVTNNDEWKYRSNLKNLTIIERNNGYEVWKEESADGSIIRFQTKEKTPYTFYSFEMESNMFSGSWSASFKETEHGGTLFTATENIRIKNVFIKTLSYLFFDIEKMMLLYEQDLKNKLSDLSFPSVNL